MQILRDYNYIHYSLTLSCSLLLTVVDTVRGNDVFVTGCETDELISVEFICKRFTLRYSFDEFELH
jgi:hypothetical protein